MNANEQKNYNVGYRQAMAGKPITPELSEYPGYAEGYDDGWCDRPSLDDAAGIDLQKEMTNPLGGF